MMRLKRFQELKAKATFDTSWFDTTITNFEKMKLKKTEIMAAHPEYSRYQDYYKNELPKFEKESWSRALKVSKSLQNVYSKSYKTLAKRRYCP